MSERTCIVCDAVFTPTSKNHPNQKHCSKKCIKKKYALANPEKNLESKRKYADANKEKHSAATEKYRKENQGYYREYASLRSRRVQTSKPKWLDEFEDLWLTELYDLAVRRGLEVDHIVPITNKIVCGLHVPWNLQLLSRKENAAKSNKFEISNH